jgi:hypothetical protein
LDHQKRLVGVLRFVLCCAGQCEKLSDNSACFKVYFIPPPKKHMYRAGHYRRWRLSPHWSPPLGVERGPRVPAPHPHVSQTPPPSSPRKPRVGDEQGLLIGGHTHHQSATNLNIPGQLSTPLCQGSCPQTVRVSAPGPARVRLSSQVSRGSGGALSGARELD